MLAGMVSRFTLYLDREIRALARDGGEGRIVEVMGGSVHMFTYSSAVQVSLDNLVPGLLGALEDTTIGGSTSVGDEAIDLAKVGQNVLDELLALLVLADIALVGLGLNAVLLGELLNVLLSTLLARAVGDGDVGAHLSAAASGLNTHTLGTRCTSNHNDLALQGEEVDELLGSRNALRHDD